jgi:CheY-like chemotaxis protein
MTGETILVVDDDRTTARVLQKQLQNLGYRVPAVASQSRQAVEKTREIHPDLVLMDIHLGDGPDGIEAADIIQSQLQVPVIYVTAHADSDTLTRAKRTRPLGYINKPLRENDLRTTLELALEQIHGNTESIRIADQALSEALNYISTGVVLLDQNLQVFFMNQIARDMLADNKQLRIQKGTLKCRTARNTLQLQKLILSENGGTLFLARETSPQPMQVLVTPLDERVDNYSQAMPIAIVFLFDPINNMESMIGTLRKLYRLTKAEARLAAALVQDPRLEQAAAAIHISISTARTHLKRIFQKTGTNRQSTLVHRIVTGPAGLLLRTSQPAPIEHNRISR